MALNLLAPLALGAGTALLGSRATSRAASAQAAASDRAAETQMEMFRQTREDNAPFRDAGLRGLAGYEATLGPSFQESPGYRFAVEEGVNAIDRGASARGLLGSGGRLRELTRFGQGMANQEFGNYQNRLASLAGIGQAATGQTNAAGMAAGQGVANTQIAGGNAQAGSIIGGTNAMLGGANQGIGLWARMSGYGR